VGYRQNKVKAWLTPGTWQKIDERKQFKNKLIKRSYIEKLADEAVQGAVGGSMSVLYKIAKRVCGNNTNQTAPVKDKNGNALTTERKQATRWVQHSQEVPNTPEPDEPVNPPPAEDVLQINTNPLTEAEGRAAIKAIKSGKLLGLTPSMLRC